MSRPLVTILLAFGLLLAHWPAAAQEKPLLSQEIRSAIEADGAAGGKARFAEIYPDQASEFEMDSRGLMMMGTEYMQAGNMEAGMAIIEMAQTINMDMMNQAMQQHAPQMLEAQKAAEEAERAAREQSARDREEAARMEQKQLEQARGKPRDDLDRFTGLFAHRDDTQRTRTLFVTRSCDGYLVVGPMWADVGPWWMRSASTTVFTYQDSYQALSVEFSDDGKSLGHDLDDIASPMEKVDTLPRDWSDCMERPLR